MQTGAYRLESAKGIIDSFPINQIIFILTIGVFLILLFPFDIFRFFTETGLSFNSWNGLPIPDLSFLSDKFQPLVNLTYLKLDTIASGLVFVLFLALITWAVMYCSNVIFQKVNHILGFPIRMLFKEKSKKKAENKKNWGETASTLNFKLWVRRHNLDKHFTYIATMREVSTALLYGSEVLVLTTLLSGFFVGDKTLWLGWLIIMILIFVFLGIVYQTYEPTYWEHLNRFSKQYHESEIWD